MTKVFYGKNNEQMALLNKEGRTPLSLADLMQKRLEALGSSSESWWWKNYFDTGDAVLYHPEGSIKVVLDAQLDLNSKVYDGALILGKDIETSISAYDSLSGAEFRRHELSGLTGRILSKDEAKAHPVWNALVPDKSLLNEYIDAAFSSGRDYAMGVILMLPPNWIANARLWTIEKISGLCLSSAYGCSAIDGYNGRLIGVK